MEIGENKSNRISINRGTAWGGGNNVENQHFAQQLHTPSASETSSRKQEGSGVLVGLLNGIVGFSLLAVFFGVPLFFTGLTLQGIAFEKQMYFYFWVFLALVAWVTKGVIVGEMNLKRTPLDLPILLFLFVYGLSTIFSVDKWHSFWGFFGDPTHGWMNVLVAVFAYYLLVNHFNEKFFKKLVLATIISNFFVLVIAFLGFFGSEGLLEKIATIVPVSTIGSFTGLSIFAAMMIPVVVSKLFNLFAAQENRKIFKISGIFALFILLIANLATLSILSSFTPWLSVVVGVSFFLIFVLADLVRPSKNSVWIPMVVFLAILAMLLIGKGLPIKINLPMETTPNYSLSWDIAKSSLKENPVLGSGPATFGYDFSKFKPQDFNTNAFYNLRFYQGTGVFFESLSTAGILGAISLVLLILSFVSVAVYLLSREKELNKINSLGIVSSAFIFVVASLASQFDGAIAIFGLLICSVSVAVLAWESRSEESHLKLSLKASPKFALAFAFIFMVISAGVVFLFLFIGKAFVADVYAGQVTRQKQVSEDGSISKLIKASNLFGNEGRYLTRIGQEYMVLANNEFLKKEDERNVENIRRYLQNSVVAAQQGSNLMKNDVLAAEVLAQMQENAVFYAPESRSLAEEAYKNALALEPQNSIYFIKLGQLKTSDIAGKTEEEKKKAAEEARDLFQQAIDKKPNSAPAYYNIALMQEALGEKDKAIESMATAFKIEGSNATYEFNLARILQDRANKEDLIIAETLYNDILKKNENDLNTNFSLGTLHEKNGKNDEAISQYQKVESLLSENDSDVKKRIEKMISNVKQGIKNTPESIGLENQTENPSPDTAVGE